MNETRIIWLIIAATIAAAAALYGTSMVPEPVYPHDRLSGEH